MTTQIILLAAALTVCVEVFAEPTAGSLGKKPTTPNTSGPHSYIGSRARAKALQTDKFPRPPMTASGTTQPKSKY